MIVYTLFTKLRGYILTTVTWYQTALVFSRMCFFVFGSAHSHQEIAKFKLELKMFYKTYTACQPPSVCTSVTPSPAPRRPRNGSVCCPYFAAYGARLTMHCQWGWLGSFSVFVPGDLDLWSLTLTFKLIRARDQTRPSCEFGANPFSGSRDIWCTNKKWRSHRRR